LRREFSWFFAVEVSPASALRDRGFVSNSRVSTNAFFRAEFTLEALGPFHKGEIAK
jgi:hypothetical protein